MKHLIPLALASALAATSAHADGESCKAVRLADLGWTDIRLTDATAETILTALGYEPTETMLGLDVAYVSLREKNMDAFLGNWRPVQNENYKEFFDKGWVVDLGENLTGAKYTLAVPKYVADQGITSFDELAKHRDMFGGKIYGIEVGSNQTLLEMITAKRHGFDDSWQVVESSEAGMLAQLDRPHAGPPRLPRGLPERGEVPVAARVQHRLRKPGHAHDHDRWRRAAGRRQGDDGEVARALGQMAGGRHDA